MDSINSFLDEYIFTRGTESRISQYGNDVVDLINKFIRIIIAFAIIYLIIQRLPDHGDKDHTMYFNLLLLISMFLLLLYIQKNWRTFYTDNFLRIGGFTRACAQDQDNPPDEDVPPSQQKCPVGFEENGALLIDSLVTGLIKELNPMENWMNYLKLIGIGLLLRQLDYKSYYALIIFIPFNNIKGIIYYILYASKYSPINFLFGKTGNVEDPYIYEDKISESKVSADETKLKNFNERFYVMYIVLILLIFFTIIIRLTSDTIINCKNFVGPIPINALQGCIGYRFYMVLNLLLFIGFSTDFMDSLDKISLEDDRLVCPWKVDASGMQSPISEQIYTAREGSCLKPGDILDTEQNCIIEEEILECTSELPPSLPSCIIKREDYNNYNYILKELSEFNDNDNNDNRIIIKKNPSGDGYIIDQTLNKIAINNSTCKNSVENWLSRQNNDNIFQPLP